MFVDDTADLASPSIFLPQSSCNLATRIRICILRYYLLLSYRSRLLVNMVFEFSSLLTLLSGWPWHSIKTHMNLCFLNWCPVCLLSIIAIWCGALISTWVAVNSDMFLWATVQHPHMIESTRDKTPSFQQRDWKWTLSVCIISTEQALSDFSKSV